MGFNEIPYDYQPKTTYQVAQILEAKYGILQTFYNMNEQKIIDSLVESYENAISDIGFGADPMALDPAGAASSWIQHEFKESLSRQAYDGVIRGVPTQASLTGRSRRFKKGYKTGTRASFIDSGLYQSSFQVWVDNVSSPVSE